MEMPWVSKSNYTVCAPWDSCPFLLHSSWCFLSLHTALPPHATPCPPPGLTDFKIRLRKCPRCRPPFTLSPAGGGHVLNSCLPHPLRGRERVKAPHSHLPGGSMPWDLWKMLPKVKNTTISPVSTAISSFTTDLSQARSETALKITFYCFCNEHMVASFVW